MPNEHDAQNQEEAPKQQNHTYKIRAERGRGGHHRGGDRDNRPQTQQYVARKNINQGLKDEEMKHQIEDDYGVEEVKGHQGQQREVVDNSAANPNNNRQRGGRYQKKQYRDDNQQDGAHPQRDNRQYQPRNEQTEPRG